MNLILIINSLLLVFSCAYPVVYAEERQVDDLPNIIICTLGGVRNSETIDDKNHQYIPNLWNKMLQYGTLYTNLSNLNLPFHQPSVQAINTGKVMTVYSRLDTPSIFQYIIKQYHLSSNRAWSCGHWNNEETVYFLDNDYDASTIPGWVRLCPPLISFEAEKILTKPELNSVRSLIKLRELKICTWPFWDVNDEIQQQIIMRILKVYKPKILHFVMGGTDCAHYDTFGRYVLAIKDTDQRVFEIWNFIQSDPYYKDNTYLFITSDHGRDRYYMNHDEYDATRQTWLYIYGPKVRKGLVIKRTVSHIDIFATIVHIMNLKAHPTKGKILEDCFIR